MTHRILLLSLPLTLTLACGDKEGNGQGSGADGSDGTGGTGGTITYDEGCILVDGDGGYAWINDAIAVASEGSTIELCAATDHEEQVVVDKSVTIVGPGSDQFTLTAPTNTVGFEVTASDVTLSGVTVSSTRSAILLDGANNASLDDIAVTAAGNWGIRSVDGTGVSIDNVSLLGNGTDGIEYGGVKIEGGSATVSNSAIQGNIGYGVWAADGAEVTITGNDISETSVFNAAGDDTDDGIGIWVTDGALVETSGNTLTGNELAALFASTGDAVVGDDEVYGGGYGVVVINGSASADGLLVDGAAFGGVVVLGETGPFSLANASITTDPATSVNNAYDAFPSGSIAGGGLVISAPEITITDVAVSGWNNAGVFIEASEAGATATLTRVNVSDVGRHGIWSNNGLVTTMTDVDVTNVSLIEDEQADRLVDVDGDGTAESDALCYYVNYWVGVYNNGGSLTWNGGSLSGVEGWGAMNLRGAMSVSGLDVQGSGCAGLMSYEGVFSATGSTFHQNDAQIGVTPLTQVAAVRSQDDSSFTLDGNTFTDNQNDSAYTAVNDYPEYGYRVTYDYPEGNTTGYDLILGGADEIEIVNNVFENGDYGLSLAGATGTVSDNTWSDYNQTVVLAGAYGSGGTTDPGNVTMEDNTITGARGNTVYCTGANLTIDGLEISEGDNHEVSYDYTYEYDTTGDGEYDSSFEYTTTSTYRNTGLYAYACDLVASDLTITNMVGNGLELRGGTEASSIDILGLEITNVATDVYADAGIAIDTSQSPLTVTLTDLILDGTGETAGIEAIESDASRITLELENASVSNTALAGLDLQGGVVGTFTNLTVDGAGGAGVSARGGMLALSGTSVTDSVGAGISLVGDRDGDGFTIEDGDCNDFRSSIYPGATESLSNYQDDDCDGVVDDGTDTSDYDGDGYSVADGDCDDYPYYGGPRIYPGATEVLGNGIDDDCDGVVDDGTNPSHAISGMTISGGGTNGVTATDVGLTFDGNTVTGNAAWGLECDNTSFDSCDSNSLSGNTGGAASGCDATCSL